VGAGDRLAAVAAGRVRTEDEWTSDAAVTAGAGWSGSFVVGHTFKIAIAADVHLREPIGRPAFDLRSRLIERGGRGAVARGASRFGGRVLGTGVSHGPPGPLQVETSWAARAGAAGIVSAGGVGGAGGK
jgi:hypothetical protein